MNYRTLLVKYIEARNVEEGECPIGGFLLSRAQLFTPEEVQEIALLEHEAGSTRTEGS